MKTFIALFVLLMSIWAQPAITLPQLGFVQDGARSLRPAYGLAGNFLLGPSAAPKIVTEAFSGSFGLFKTESSLAAFDLQGKLLGSMNATGPALFAFSAEGSTALAYLVSSNTLVEWRDNGFVPLGLRPEIAPHTIVAIALPSSSEVLLFVETDAEISEVAFPLNRASAYSQRVLSGIAAPLLSLPSGDLVYRDATGIVVRKPDASEVRIAASLPASFSLRQMNRDWVQLSDLNSAARFAIRATPGREGFYRLPE